MNSTEEVEVIDLPIFTCEHGCVADCDKCATAPLCDLENPEVCEACQ